MLATFTKDKKQSKKLISSYIETPYLQLPIAVFDIIKLQIVKGYQGTPHFKRIFSYF